MSLNILPQTLHRQCASWTSKPRKLSSASVRKLESCMSVVSRNVGEQIAETLFPFTSSKSTFEMPDYEYIHRELQKDGVTLNLLWLEILR